MANFYTDIPELKFHLNNPMMERICQLKERDYAEKDNCDYAPVDYADALDSYHRVLDIVGDISANIVAPNAEGVDARARIIMTAAWITPAARWRTLRPWWTPA